MNSITEIYIYIKNNTPKNYENYDRIIEIIDKELNNLFYRSPEEINNKNSICYDRLRYFINKYYNNNNNNEIWYKTIRSFVN